MKIANLNLKILRSNWVVGALLLMTIVAGYKLRMANYATVPFPGESRDEYGYAWLGLSLLEVGYPISASGFAAYQPTVQYINVDNIFQHTGNANPIPITKPWFDHPPLFSLIPGGFAYLKGLTTFADTSLIFIRKPMVWLAVVNIALIFWLTVLLFGRLTGLIAAALYATEPLIVVSSRMVQVENFLITLFLAALLSFFYYQKTRQPVFFWLAISIAGIATLCKISGVSIAGALIFLTVITENAVRFKKSAQIIVGTLGIFAFFPLYGALYDWPMFVLIWTSNTGRFFKEGLSAFEALLFHQNITRDFSAGIIPFGFLSLVVLATVNDLRTKTWYVLAPVVSYLAIYLLLGSQDYGWYKFPFFPFLVIAASWAVVSFIKRPNPLFAISFLGLPLAITLNRLVPPSLLPNYFSFYRLGVVGLLGIILLPFIAKNERKATWLYQATMIGLVLLLLALNIYTNQQITIDKWYNQEWLRGI